MTLINRRIPNVIVPIDENSWTIFYNGNEINGRYIALPIQREDLKKIFETGFFNYLNTQFGILIDEYEEDEISGQVKLEELRKIIIQYNMQIINPILKFYFDKLLYLVDKAIKFNTVIMFYF